MARLKARVGLTAGVRLMLRVRARPRVRLRLRARARVPALEEYPWLGLRLARATAG